MSVFSKIRAVFNDRKGALLEVNSPQSLPPADIQQAFYGYLFPRSTEMPLSVPQKLVIEHLKNSLPKREFRDKVVPRLPAVIPRLLRSLRNPKSSAREYVEIINKDPTMSAAVLKLANSVYFNPIGKRIHDIDRAVVKLGINGIRLVLSAAVMQPIIQRDAAYSMQTGQRLWFHAMECAVTCASTAQERGLEPFKAYLVGLVHDIGKITLFSELSKQFKLNSENVIPESNAFVPIMQLLAPATSYWIARDWELPAELCKAIAEQVSVSPGDKISPYGAILFEANLACEAYVAIRPKDAVLAQALLAELHIPTNMFTELDELSREV
ncbi:HDOD domain-containing protein [Teredinibacter turnerae]|uniref:HDOD domain-containing protein n=1 Tax=Teredinibacter turnerae TaxID=2426 RepID=UPI000410C51D|nr:HDOD domain-containing protein [Teredinibacter turnerae]